MQVLAFSSDHSYLATGSNDSYIRLWSRSSNWTMKNDLNNGPTCGTLLQLPNGQLAAGSANDINIWDPLNNQNSPLRTLVSHGTTVLDLDLSPDGLLLASGATAGGVRLWNYTSLTTPVLVIGAHTTQVRAVCFISNQILATGSFDMTIKLWSTTTGESIDFAIRKF